MSRLLFAWLLVFVCVLCCLPAAAQPVPRAQQVVSDHPIDAVQGIVNAFQLHPVVVIGEWKHGIRQMGDFYVQLVNDPSFQQTVRLIVIEFASQNNQFLLDRYIAGEDIPVEQVRHIWRDTTKVAAWEFPIYSEWLAAIREVNRKLPPDRRFRVLAGDTAVDWSRLHTRSDWDNLGDNNKSFADVIVKEVLAKHRKALVVLGGGHVAKLGRNGSPNTSTIVEAKYPGSLYVVMHHLLPNDPDEKQLQLPGRPQAPALYDLAGTALGLKPDGNGVAPVRYLDAWLYVGPADTMNQEFPPPRSLERSYMQELDRRSMIEWGEPRVRKFLGDAAEP